MFKCYVDGALFYNSASNDTKYQILSPKLELAENSAGSFSFILPPTNVKAGSFEKLTSRITIKKFDTLYWEGRIISDKEDFWKCHTYECEGTLAFLNDTIQPTHKYSNLTPQQFVTQLLANHNSKVSSDKKIYIGTVSIDDTTRADRYTNFETTFDLIRKQVETSGGHVTIGYRDNKRYLDWSDTYSSHTTQEIRFGENLLDYSSNMTLGDFCTVLIPQGVKLEDSGDTDFDTYLDVHEVNNGSIYVSLTADDYTTPPSVLPINAFGRLELVKRWEDITLPANLLTRAKKYLKDQQFENLQLEVNAFDLRYASTDYTQISLLDAVRVLSDPHGLDKVFPVKKMNIPLDSPENTAFTIGGDSRSSNFTSIARYSTDAVYDRINEIPTEAAITRQYRQEISSKINEYTVGYINIISHDSQSQEFVISDSPNYLTASRVWRWNLNGLAFSDSGYDSSTYRVAITADGRINADLISTGTLNADLITAGILEDQNDGQHFRLNLATGELYINQLDVIATDLEESGGRNLIINTKAPIVSNQAKWPRLREQLDNTRSSGWTVTKASHGIRMTKGSSDQTTVAFTMGYTNPGSSLSGMNGLIAGLNYTFSSTFKYHLFSSGSTKVYAQWRLITYASNTSGASARIKQIYKKELLRDTQKTIKMKFTFDVPSDSEVACLYFNFIDEANINQTATAFASTNFYEFANMKLERGSTATAWSAAPEDVPGNDELISKINISPEEVKINANKITLAGSTINLTGDNITISSDNFSVSSAGAITASSGKIGRYTISSTSLYTRHTEGDDTTMAGMGGNQAFWAGAGSSNSAPFRVSYTGDLVATSATITGQFINKGGISIDASSWTSNSYVATHGPGAETIQEYYHFKVNTTNRVPFLDSELESGSLTLRQGPSSGSSTTPKNVSVLNHSGLTVTDSGSQTSSSQAYNRVKVGTSTIAAQLQDENGGSVFAGYIDSSGTMDDGAYMHKDGFDIVYHKSTNRASFRASGLTFYDSSGNTTFQYPSSGLRLSQLNDNVSDAVTTSGTAKDYTLPIGTFLLTITRYSNADTTRDGVWLVSCVTDTSTGGSRSHLIPIVVGANAPTPGIQNQTLKITTNIGYQRITITRLS